MRYINRTLEETLKEYIGCFPVITITGPRQVGKTTLLEFIKESIKERINYVTLDDMFLRAQANEDPELFLRTHELPLIIDEFQYAPNLLSYIKIRVDEARKDSMFGNKTEVGTLYYLTGSQVFETMENISDSLAGRVGILDMYAFTSRELNNQRDELFVPEMANLKKRTPLNKLSTRKLYEKILRGFYPELNNNKNISPESFYSAYVRTYIERDVRKLINLKYENTFIRFISAIAARTAQEYNANNLSIELGIDNKTVDEWLSILKNTGIIFLLQPYTNNSVSRAIKRPKIYFTDTGLACYLSGYTNAEILEKSAYSGAIFETYVVSDIIKTFANHGKDPKKHLYYYRDNNQKEIDLLIADNNIIYPIEIKKSANPGKEAIKNFDVVKNFQINRGNGVVLCLASNIVAIDENNYIVPIEYI